MNQRLAPWEDGSRNKLPGLRVPTLNFDSLRRHTETNGIVSAKSLSFRAVPSQGEMGPAKSVRREGTSMAHTARDELLSYIKSNPSTPDSEQLFPTMPSERSRYARSLKMPATPDSTKSVPQAKFGPPSLSSWGSVRQTPNVEYRLRQKIGKRLPRTKDSGGGGNLRPLTCPLMFMDVPELASDYNNGYVFMSASTTTTELFSVRMRDAAGSSRLLTFDLRQRIREKGHAGDLVVYKYEFHELMTSSFHPPWKKMVTRMGKEVEWTKEMKRSSFWEFKSNGLDLQLVPNTGELLSDDSDADSEFGQLRQAHEKLPINEQDMFQDKRLYRSHAAQIAEMNHYLKWCDMESAERLNNVIILPQIAISLRRRGFWGAASNAIKRKRPDFDGLVQVSLHFLFLKHAEVRGTLDETRLRVTEIEAALRDEEFWGECQICEFFTIDDLAFMCKDRRFAWAQFPGLLQEVRLLADRRVELVDKMNALMDSIDDEIARHKSSDAMDGIEALKEVADNIMDSLVHGEASLKPDIRTLSKAREVIAIVEAEEHKVHRLNRDAKHHHELWTSLEVLFGLYIKTPISNPLRDGLFVPFMAIFEAAIRRRIRDRQLRARELLIAVEQVVKDAVAEGETITRSFISALQAIDLSAARKATEQFSKVKERFQNRMKPPSLLHLLASFKFANVSEVVVDNLMNLELSNAEVEVTRIFFEEWSRVQRKSMPYTWLLKMLFEHQSQKFNSCIDAVQRDIDLHEKESLQVSATKAEAAAPESFSSPMDMALHDDRLDAATVGRKWSSLGSPLPAASPRGSDQRVEDLLSTELAHPLLHKLCCFKECMESVARAYSLLCNGQLKDCQQAVQRSSDLADEQQIRAVGSLAQCIAKVRQQLAVTRIGMFQHKAAAAILASASHHQEKRVVFDGSNLKEVVGMLSDELLGNCKAQLKTGGGWRLSTEPVRKLLRMVKEEHREFLAHVLFCEEVGSEYSWSMLVLDLGNLSHHLLLNDNRLTSIPVEVFEDHLAQLPLHTLNLSCNELEDIPPTIESLTKLKHLLLDSNRLSNLPVNLGNLLPTLEEVTLSDNLPFENPPQEIVALGGMDAVEFLKGIADQGVQNRQMELILVGMPNVGKTSTQKAIVGDDPENVSRLPLHNSSNQVGISTTHWNPGTPSADGLSFVILDIGGQSLYSTLHQYFLSRRAVYGLVWRLTRLNNTNENSEEFREEMDRLIAPVLAWMQDLQLRVPGAFVVLIATHVDCAPGSQASKQLRAVKGAVDKLLKRQQATIDDHLSCGNKTHIRPLHVWNNGDSIAIDCLKGTGIETCREALISQAKRMPLFGEVIPSSYLKVRDSLRAMRRSPNHVGRPWLPWKAFRDVATKCGVCPSQPRHDFFSHALDAHPKSKAKHSAKQSLWLAKHIRRSTMKLVHEDSLLDDADIRRLQSSKGGLPDEVPPEEQVQDEVPQRFTTGEKYICRLQSAFKRIHSRFEFLHNRRLHHRERMHCEMNVAMSFLHDTGDVRFFGIGALKEMFSTRQRKAILQERLFQLHNKVALTVEQEEEQSRISHDVDQLNEQWKALRRSFRESILLSTVYVDPGWVMDVMKGLINPNLPRLYSYFKKQEGPEAEKMTLMVKEMGTRGIVNTALFPYLWPATAESQRYWDLVRENPLEAEDWPYNVVTEGGSFRDVAVHARMVALLGAFDVILKKENNTLVAPSLLRDSRAGAMPSQAFSDDHSPLCCHLVYDSLPDGYLQRLVVRCSRLAMHVDFNKTMATFYNRGQKALVSVVRVKDPSTNLPKHLFEGVASGWSLSQWKSEESRKAIVRKAGGTRLRGSDLDTSISKAFHAFDGSNQAGNGMLTLTKAQVLKGMQNLGVRLSSQEIDRLFEEADTDNSSELDEFEFSELVKTLFRKSELGHLKNDQTHVVLKCSTKAQQRAFLDAIDDLEKGFPGLLRVAFIEPNAESAELPCEVALCRPPESSMCVFAVEKVNRAYIIENWTEEASKCFGVELTEQTMRGRNLLDVVHPIVKSRVESCLKQCFAVIQAHGIGKEEWVTCGLQFKSLNKSARRPSVASAVSSDGGFGGMTVFPVKGVLMQRNHEDTSHGHWREKVYELYQDGNLMYYSAKMQGYSAWNVSNCTLSEIPEEDRVGLLQEYLPFRLNFEDGRSLDFAALTQSEYLLWIEALQTVCSLAVVPVDLIPRCVDTVEGSWKIQVYCNLASTIKYELDRNGISFEDNFHHKSKVGSNPRAAICFIENGFFGSSKCAQAFSEYAENRMSIIPIITPDYKFPKDIHGNPNFMRWWKPETRWDRWKDYALFINMQKKSKQESQVKEVLIPTIESHLEQWRGTAPFSDDKEDSTDHVTCVKCTEIGLRHKGAWKRLEILEQLRKWRAEEQTRRGKGMDPTQEPMLQCDKCEHIGTVSDCLSTGAIIESIPCPSCTSENLVPPYCFSRQQCLLELRNSDKAGTAILFCPVEKKTIRILDILVPECFISYHWGDRMSNEGGQEYFVFQERIQKIRLHVEEEALVVCWLDVAGGMKAGDNMLHAMKHGVKKATVFLMFINDDYVRSHNCIREFSHAVENSKFIIPVLTEPYFRLRNLEVEGSKWWPDDSKHPDGGIAPWSILKNFEPIDLRKTAYEVKGKGEIVKRILSRFRKTVADDQDLQREYNAWRRQIPKLIDPKVGKAALENRIREVFHELDKDYSGSLDVVELTSALQSFGIALSSNSEKDADALLAEADINGDGRIDLPEFIVMMNAIFQTEDDFLLDPEHPDLDRRLISMATLKRAVALTRSAVSLRSARPNKARSKAPGV